jgi:hypothetical protein
MMRNEKYMRLFKAFSSSGSVEERFQRFERLVGRCVLRALGISCTTPRSGSSEARSNRPDLHLVCAHGDRDNGGVLVGRAHPLD